MLFAIPLPWRRPLTGLLRLLVMLVLLCVPAQGLEVPGDQPSLDLTDQLVFAPGTSETPQTMADRFYAGGFGSGLSVDAFEANHAPERWAAVVLETRRDQSGRLLIEAPLASEVDVYLVRGTQVVHVLQFSLFDPFDAAEHAGRRLASAEVTLEPDAPLLALVHIKFGPFERFRMAFEQAETTLAKAQGDMALQGAFYAFGLACLLVFVALFAALEDWISLLYALLFLLGLMLLAFIDGWLFRLVYPGHPGWQQPVGFGVLFGLGAAGYALARHGFVTSGWPRAAWISTAAIGLCVLGYGAALLSPGPFAAALGNLLLAGMVVAVLWGTRLWELRHVPAQPLSAGLSILAGLGIAALLGALAVGGAGVLPDVPTVGKVLYLMLLFSTLIKFTAQVVVIRREHSRAQAAEMAALTREAALARDLAVSEQSYSRVRDLAEARRQHLARASHDLRQPLASLRMTVDSLAARVDPDTRTRLNEAFAYISGLSGSYLDAATDPHGGDTANPEAHAASPAPGTTDTPRPQAEDPYEIGLVLQTVAQMFDSEASQKGLRLRAVPSHLLTDVPPMTLMRIVANLTSNAVKATDDGGVLLGVRRRDGQPVLYVCDTGPGLSAQDIAHFRAEGAKGATSDGHGIGLAVCFSEAAAHGITLTATGVPGRGTGFALALPRIAQDASGASNEGSTP